jgi:glycosyltransferase involved in cell wall biosynthesis
MILDAAAALIVGLPCFALMMTVLNTFAWPRARHTAQTGSNPKTAVLIPARNEEATISASIAAALANKDVDEVIVCDDHSTDDTRSLVLGHAEDDDRVRLIDGADLPPGWIGKPHACHQLRAATNAELLVFVDADVRLQPDGVARVRGLQQRYDANVLTGVPLELQRSFGERLVVPLLYTTYTSWLFLPLIWRSKDARFLAANGQLLAVQADVYDAVGGFQAVRSEVVDDMAFCRLAKVAGNRVVFFDGQDVAACRMYASFDDVWAGFSKNIAEGIGSSVGVIAAALLYFATFVAPYVALFVPALFWPAVAGVCANLLLRTVGVLRNGQPIEGVVTHPLGAMTLIAIALNSLRWTRAGTIAWRDRVYAPRAARLQQSEEP